MQLRAARVVGLIVAACWLLPAGADDRVQGPWSLSFDFEGDQPLAGWYTTAQEGALAVTTDPELVRSGQGSLELRYQPRTGCLATVGVKSLTMEARPRALSFSLRTSEPTPVLFGVSEADGSSYEGYCYSAGGEWYDVALDLDELMLGSSSSDEDGDLDARQIAAVFIADLSNLPGEVGKSLGIKQGPQTLWLDDVRLCTDLAPHRSSRSPKGAVVIYDFDETPPPCLPLGGPELTLTTGPDAQDPKALRVGYDKEGYGWVGLVAGVGHLDLSGRQAIELTLQADAKARLTLVLEERDGSKYTTRLTLDPAQGWHTVRLAFSKFKLDSATSDENSVLDLDQLRVIIPVVDAQRAELGATGRGSYTISRIACPRTADNGG